jgi:hypothetical protein
MFLPFYIHLFLLILTSTSLFGVRRSSCCPTSQPNAPTEHKNTCAHALKPAARLSKQTCLRFNRIVQVGDTSGLQSPLSFGGFGSLLRHLPRISTGLTEALEADLTTKEDLDALQPYLPSLSTMWLFQKAMSVKPGRSVADP